MKTSQGSREAPAPRPSGGEVGEPSRSEGEPGDGATRLSLDQKLKADARGNKRKPTLAERKLRSRLRNQRNGVTFRRQHVIGHYIVDFFCSPAKLAIEIDGASHDDTDRFGEALAENLIGRLPFSRFNFAGRRKPAHPNSFGTASLIPISP